MIEAWLMMLDKESGRQQIAPLGSTFGTICLGMEFTLSSERPEVPHGHLFFRLGLAGEARNNEIVFISVKKQPTEVDLERFVRMYEYASNIRDLEPNPKGPWLSAVVRPNLDGLLYI